MSYTHGRVTRMACKRARRAIEAAFPGRDEDVETNISDVLSDLMHLAHKHGLKMRTITHRALNNFAAEGLPEADEMEFVHMAHCSKSRAKGAEHCTGPCCECDPCDYHMVRR